MRLPLIPLTLAVLCAGAAPHPANSASPPACDAARTLRVLFVGNSFTYVHNMPAMVQQIGAELPGPCIETQMIATGGATLEAHWTSGDSVARRIREGSWTHVVLNDQSTLGEGWFVEGVPRMGTSGRELRLFGGRFADVIRASGAQPVLIAHWTDDDASSRDQRALDYIFTSFARDAHVGLAPVGAAVKRMRAQLPRTTPYFSDGHHLSPAGAYLEALVIYATLTGRTVAGAPRRIRGPAVEFNRGIIFPDSVVTLVDLGDADAAAIQGIAAAAATEYRARIPDIAAPAPLSAELPADPSDGDAFTRPDLHGEWRGRTMVLPPAQKDSAAIEFSLTTREGASRADTLRIRIPGGFVMQGAVAFEIDGSRVIMRAALLPTTSTGRGRPLPLDIELRGVLRGGIMVGNAVIRQTVAGSLSSFNAVGRFNARRVAESPRSSIRGDSKVTGP